MERRTFKLGYSTRYRYRCHAEPVSSKYGSWLLGEGSTTSSDRIAHSAIGLQARQRAPGLWEAHALEKGQKLPLRMAPVARTAHRLIPPSRTQRAGL
jgi:hypothetical protein